MENKNSLIYLIELPTVSDDGMLTFGQSPHIPFLVRRFYYIYDCIPGLLRGKHAHYNTQQILFCLRGSVRIVLDNGHVKEEVVLNKPNVGVMLDKMMWHDMCDISKETLMMIVASEEYKSEDYIRDYSLFIKLTNGR